MNALAQKVTLERCFFTPSSIPRGGGKAAYSRIKDATPLSALKGEGSKRPPARKLLPSPSRGGPGWGQNDLCEQLTYSKAHNRL